MEEPTPTPLTFPTWKTIKLGTHQSTKDLLWDLLEHNIQLEDPIMLKNITIASEPTQIDLVRIPVSSLNLDSGEQRREVHLFNRIKELGLELVPAEVGPQLCLQYQDQTLDEGIIIASEPIRGGDANVNLFVAFCTKEEQWLLSTNGLPMNFSANQQKWVVAQRIKS